MDRRSFLTAIGLAGGGVGAGFLWFGRSGREGRVFWRRMAVDAGGDPGSLIVLTESLSDDGTVTRDVHPDYADAFQGGFRVPESLHRRLRQRFGADEPYYLLRYDGEDCNGIPRDEGGDAVEVSRSEFNRNLVGDCVTR